MEMYSKIRNYCERHYQRYGDGFRTTDGVGNFSFMVKNEKILVLYSGKCNTTILQINEDDCGNANVARLSPNYDVMITEKAYDLVGDILSGIGIPIPDTETPSVIRAIQDTREKDKMRLVELLDKTLSDINLSAEETEELEGLCCEFFITKQGSLDWDNFKDVISNCKLNDYYSLMPGETDSFGLLSAVLICPNNYRIVFG